MRIVPQEEWSFEGEPEFVDAAVIDESFEELERRFDTVFLEDDVDGWGKSRLQFFMWDDGRKFFVEKYLKAAEPMNKKIHIYMPNKLDTMYNDLMDILEALDIPYNRVFWTRPDMKKPGGDGPRPPQP